jgi:hypothetical protein
MRSLQKSVQTVAAVRALVWDELCAFRVTW